MAGPKGAVVADCLQPPSAPSDSEAAEAQHVFRPESSGADESLDPSAAEEIPGPYTRASGGKEKVK